MSVPQSAIDSRVYLWLGDCGQQVLNPTIEHMMREDVIARHITELDLSHQNKRTKVATINLPLNSRDFTMPSDFANPVLARMKYAPNASNYSWLPVDIINLDTMPARETDMYPSICFFGPNNTARTSFVATQPVTMEVYYADMTLPSKLPTAPMPIADLFLGMVSAEIALQCLPACKITVEQKLEFRTTIERSLAQWLPLWSRLMNRAPNAGSLRTRGFMSNYNFGPGRGWIGGY